jgi:predicted RNase H-like HicB family nuclease
MPKKSTIIISKEGKWYVARSAELGVVSQGRTVEEAESNIKEAVELYLEDQPEKRKDLPSGIPYISWLDL